MYNERTNTKEYRGAFYDWIRKSVKGESATEERSVLYATDNKSAIPVPKSLDTAIWDNIHTAHPIWDDLDVQHVPGVLEVTRHVGSAKDGVRDMYWVKKEGELYETEELKGVDIRKTVQLSYAAAEMSNGALEDYLVSELSADIADEATMCIVKKIEKCRIYHNDHRTVYDEYNIPRIYRELSDYNTQPRNCWNAGCMTTDKSRPYENGTPDAYKSEYEQHLNYNWLCRVIGSCNSSNIKIYTDRYHGFRNLYCMVDNTGQPVFRRGQIIDYPVVLDDAFAKIRYHNENYGKDQLGSFLMAIDTTKVIVNVIRPLTIEITRKPADGVLEITGSMRLDATMRDRSAFAYWLFSAPDDAPPVESAALTVALAAPVATDVEDGDYDNYAVVDGLYTGDTAENADAWISTESTGTTPEYDYANTDTGYFKPGDTVDVTVETDSDFFDGTKTAVLSADGAIAPEDGEEITGNGNTYTVTIPNRENNTLMVHLNRTADGTSATPGDYEIMAVDVDDDGTELPPERKRIVIRRKHQEGTPEKPAPKRSRRKRG